MFIDSDCGAVDIMYVCVTLEHKTSHNGQFYEIEMYKSSES